MFLNQHTFLRVRLDLNGGNILNGENISDLFASTGDDIIWWEYKGNTEEIQRKYKGNMKEMQRKYKVNI